MDQTADRQRVSVYTKPLHARRREQQQALPFAVAPAPVVIQPKARSRATLGSLDLFTGAGGLTLGLHEAGFRPDQAVELTWTHAKRFEAPCQYNGRLGANAFGAIILFARFATFRGHQVLGLKAATRRKRRKKEICP